MMRVMIRLLALFCLFSFKVSAECGKLVTALLKYDPAAKTASFEKFYFKDESFCDAGLVEVNANLVVELIAKSGKVVASKKIFLNSFSLIESLDKKQEGVIVDHKVVKMPQYRTVKFSVSSFAELEKFKIAGLTKGELLGVGVVRE